MIPLARNAVAQSCALRTFFASTEITPSEVLGRLKAAFGQDDWCGPAGYPSESMGAQESCPSWEERHGDPLRRVDAAIAATFPNGGYSAGVIPDHAQRRPIEAATGMRNVWLPGGGVRVPLPAAERQWLADNRAALRLPASGVPDGKTHYEAELIERCRKKVVRRCNHEPAYWARLCKARERLPKALPFDRNAEARADEAAEWIMRSEADPAVEADRKLTLLWLRSRQSQRAFAGKEGLHRTELRRAVDNFCDAVADRLNAAPARSATRCADLGHLHIGKDKAPAKVERLVWAPALATDVRVVSTSETLARGLDDIARTTNRSPASALRLIQGGKAPIANLDGQPVALRRSLLKYRSKRQPSAQMAA